jgi:hypothetical protein
MKLLELIPTVIASLGILFGIGVLLRTLSSAGKGTMKKIIVTPAAILTMLTILSCALALAIENFFYDIPAIPLLLGGGAVPLLSRRLMMAMVNHDSRRISVIWALTWGIWSFCVYLLLAVIVIPDYPRLHGYNPHMHLGFGLMLLGLSVAVMLLSWAINLTIGIRATSKHRKEDF